MRESLKIAQRKYRLKNREKLNEKQRHRISQEPGHGSVYMICSKNSDLVYIGSTIYKLDARLSCHLIKYNCHLKGQKNSYCTSSEVLKHGDCYIQEIEHMNIKSRRDLYERENYWITQMTTSVNKNIPGRVDPAYWKEYHRKYNQENKHKYKDVIDRAVRAANMLRQEFKRLSYMLLDNPPRRGRPRKSFPTSV